MACGELGLNIKYFYSLTPREFYNHVTGYRKKQEEEFKNSWQQTRRIMHAVLLPHQRKGSSLTLEKVMQFPWEHNNGEIQALSDAEAQQILNEVQAQQEFWDKVDNGIIRKLDC